MSNSEREGPPAGRPQQEQDHLPMHTVRIPHSSSYDVSDRHKKDPPYYPQQQQQQQQQGYNDHHGAYGSHYQNYQVYPNPTPRHGQPRVRQVVTDGSFGNSSGGNSHSFEDERDDFSGRARDPRYASHGGNQGYYHRQQGSPTAESRYPEERQEDMREGSEQQRDQAHHVPPRGGYVMENPAMVPPSPSSKRSIDEMTSQDSSEMSTSAPTFMPPSDNLKRSFFHHSTPGDRRSSGSSLPPDFMPPKKARVGKSPPKNEKVLTPRHPGSQGYFNRTHSWGSHDGAAFGPPHQQRRPSNSFPDPATWDDAQMDHSQRYYGGHHGEQREYPPSHDQRSPQSAFRPSPRSSSHGQPYYPPSSRSLSPPDGDWRGAQDMNWAQTPASPRNPTLKPSWSGNLGHPPRHHRERDDTPARTSFREDTSVDSAMRRQVTFESGGDMDGYHRGRGYSYDRHAQQGHPHYPPPASQSTKPKKSRNSAESSQKRYCSTLPPVLESGQEEVKVVRTDGSNAPILLSQPEDRIALSETLCVIRENIEVFSATMRDVEAPAPGRKHPVVVGQLGLRCIHCSHAEKHSDKVKRATCYPSSIKRIYRTVIDMKLDHFSQCPFVPEALRARLAELKAANTRSTGTTMQYFVRSAIKMGMVDANPGVRLIAQEPVPEVMEQRDSKDSMESLSFPEPMKESSPEQSPVNEPSSSREEHEPPSATASSGSFDSMRTPESNRYHSLSEQSSTEMMEVMPIDSNEEIPEFTGIALLALPEDTMSLSPLRCFLRQNVCAFSATEEDIAVRTPTTFSVVKGQVGIGCIHCQRLPAKERSNRAVCFPFSLGRIYQSVADIQRFHFSECKMIPKEVRDMFNKLQKKSSKGSKGLATRQYWVSSAKKIGLVDTSKGIRFGRDPTVPEAPAVSLDILAQVASNVTTVNRALVIPEDRGTIAEFLYVVMGQLQPCRFTEADRNKRRLKNVGCIGVECKHCAGTVDSRKFFWSSVNAVESNFVSVHTHMLECKHIPDDMKEHIAELKTLRKEQTQNLKVGSQKAFFARVWERLHKDDRKVEAKPEAKPGAAAESGDSDEPTQGTNVDSVRDKMAVVSV